MKTTLSLTVVFLLLLGSASCGGGGGAQSSATAPSPTSAQTTEAREEFADLAGRWTGNAKVIVQWAKQKDLRVDLVIEPDGRVSGTVGDARLVDARLRTQRFGSPLRVNGSLEGNLIDAEAIHRDAVDVLLHRAADGTLTGGVHSSGGEFGGKERMKLSASGMTLRRTGPDSNHTSPPATRAGQ